LTFEDVGTLTLSGEELATLYRMLKSMEAELSREEERLLTRVERTLYEGLSIEEMERLEEEIRSNR
jgi:hypothetical protein